MLALFNKQHPTLANRIYSLDKVDKIEGKLYKKIIVHGFLDENLLILISKVKQLNT